MFLWKLKGDYFILVAMEDDQKNSSLIKDFDETLGGPGAVSSWWFEKK